MGRPHHPPDTAAQPTGRGASPALPLPRDHPGWAWPRRPWCLHTSPSLGLPPPSPPPPPYRGRGSELRAPSVPQNLLQVYSCASRPSSTQFPGPGRPVPAPATPAPVT